jgi:hypothetical protein
MPVQGTLTFTFQASDTRQVGIGPANANIPINYAPQCAFIPGTGALGVQVLWQPPRTFSGTTDSLNFNSGLVDS